MKNVILYGVLAFIFATTSAVSVYADMAAVAAIWAFSTGIWTALTMQAWHFRND